MCFGLGLETKILQSTKQLTSWKRIKKIKLQWRNAKSSSLTQQNWTCNWSTSPPPDNLTTHIMWSTFIHCKSRAKNWSILLLFNLLFVSQKSPRANLPSPPHPKLITHQPTYLPTHLPKPLPTHLPTHLPTYQSLYQPTCLPTHLLTHPPKPLGARKLMQYWTNPHYLSHNSCLLPFSLA